MYIQCRYILLINFLHKVCTMYIQCRYVLFYISKKKNLTGPNPRLHRCKYNCCLFQTSLIKLDIRFLIFFTETIYKRLESPIDRDQDTVVRETHETMNADGLLNCWFNIFSRVEFQRYIYEGSYLLIEKIIFSSGLAKKFFKGGGAEVPGQIHILGNISDAGHLLDFSRHW